MHYRVGKSNARFTSRGTAKAPFFGPMVLLDYLAPKYAQAFRRLAASREATWVKVAKLVPHRPTDTDYGKAVYMVRRHHPLWKKEMVKFNRLCTAASREELWQSVEPRKGKQS